MRAMLRLALAAIWPLAGTVAQGGEGASTTYLNVRSGPGAGNPVIAGLTPGENVQIIRCDANAWCQIAGDGKEGWVASRFLTAGANAPELDRRCSWVLDTTLPDPAFNAVCPAGVEPPPPPPPPGDLVCLFERPTYGGTRTCLDVGDYLALEAALDDTFSSVQVQGDARVRLCTEADLGGFCVDWTANATELGRRMDDAASSVKVYVGYLPPPPPPPPEVFSEGRVSVTPNGRANLDRGAAGPAGADIWWRSADVIEPVNGAQLSRGSGADRSLAECRTERFDERPLDWSDLADGSVVCVKTNLGRVGRFQIVEAGDTLTVGYVTWVPE